MMNFFSFFNRDELIGLNYNIVETEFNAWFLANATESGPYESYSEVAPNSDLLDELLTEYGDLRSP